MHERSIFMQALEYDSPAERLAWLDEACANDHTLRQRVEALLCSDDQAGSFLRKPVPERLAEQMASRIDMPPGDDEGPGTVIGPYKLLQRIGEGGMGMVYMAEQSHPVHRKVALKIIKAGMESGQVIARFEAERQALALMDHPNIAKIHDAGTTGRSGVRNQGSGVREEVAPPPLTPAPGLLTPDLGRPYIVMELVKGVPITSYCDENQLPPAARLELFARVCHAVHHAHQKGVIHRDLKPTNVLIALYDGQPVPKIIDFGVAKAIGSPLTERTMFTAFGQIVGTLEYMSPEQAQLNALDVDTRSDIYALGVLLYELLTGTTPFDKKRLRDSAFDEMLRVIREEEPPPPSTRFSTAESPAAIAAKRSMQPDKLRGLLRGELDWIVMKALEKDRNRRYETAGDLAADIERYLADEAVLACPPSVRYRLSKFVRRNRGTVLAAGFVVLALVAGIIGTTWGMIRAEQASRKTLVARLAEAERAEGEQRARQEAQKRLIQIEAGTELLASMIEGVDPLAAERERLTSRDLLLRRLGEAAQQLDGETVGDPLVVARLQHVLGVSLQELGDLKQAEAVLVKACRIRERILGADHLETAATKHHLAIVYRSRAKYGLAERLCNEVLETRAAKLGPDHPDTLDSQHHLAVLYHASHHDPQATETLFEEVVKLRTARLGADHPDTLTSQHRLALLYRSQWKYDRAETLCRKVLELRTIRLGADHLDTLASKHLLAALYRTLGKSVEAETLYKEVLQIRTDKLGADHLDTLTSQHHLALLYAWSMPKFDLATRLLEETLALRKVKLGPDHPTTLATQFDLGTVYCDAGQFAAAIPLLQQVHQKGRNHRLLVSAGSVLLRAYLGAGKRTEATALATELLDAARREFPIDSLEHYAALASAGWALTDANACDQAEPLLREALSRGERYFPDSWRTRHTTLLLGVALLGQQKFAEAEPLLLSSYDALTESDTEGSMQLALQKLVELYEAWGKPDQAAEWRKRLNERAGPESDNL